jgi:hypothetical protein
MGNESHDPAISFHPNIRRIMTPTDREQDERIKAESRARIERSRQLPARHPVLLSAAAPGSLTERCSGDHVRLDRGRTDVSAAG